MSIEVQWLGRIEYSAALELQDKLVGEVIAGGPERLLLLEHEPVYTIGRTRDRSSLHDPDHLPHPVFETNRGGQATWHGPGQLVAYPILNLQDRGRDLHLYMRFLEEIVIECCKAVGVAGGRSEGLTGVWVGDRKIASIGVGVRKWVSMHGLALNVTTEALAAFSHITPCGIQNVEMTTLEKEAGKPLTVRETADSLAKFFLAELPKLSAPAA